MVSDRDAWQVFIPDSHEGYISLETYERNRRVIADNSTKMMPSGSRGALPAGLLRCGHCGRRMAAQSAVQRFMLCHNGNNLYLDESKLSGNDILPVCVGPAMTVPFGNDCRFDPGIVALKLSPEIPGNSGLRPRMRGTARF